MQIWRSKPGRRYTGRVELAGETIYAGSVDRKVYAVDLATGQTRWSARLGGIIGGGVLVSGDTVYVATSRPDGRVSALDARTGHRFWRTATGPVGAPLALVDGVLVAQTQRGEIVGLEPTSGAVRWRRKLGVARVAAIPADGGSLIVATVDSLFRMGARDGKVSRRVASPGAIVSSWVEHGASLVAGTTDSLVVGVDRGDLHTRWQVALDAPVLGSPAPIGDTIFAVSRRGSLYRVSADSAPVATRVAELRWPVTSPVTTLDGLLLLGGADGTLRALHPDGGEAWRLQLQWPIELGPLPLSDGMLGIGGDGDLHRYRR
ncbi:MAG TPA: PQQ-binding-like beta-propeller repeat protein [Gemmatimonadales bacterium]|nr:PQQ-binding-like beta-propeller repeat protein [Gemmatimonadales bacterium]